MNRRKAEIRARRRIAALICALQFLVAVGGCASSAPKKQVYIDNLSELPPYVVRTRSSIDSESSVAPEPQSAATSQEAP